MQPATESRRGNKASLPKQLIESTAERVFVTHPRIFSFSHRTLASLRHPHLPMAVQIAEADLAKPKRNWQTKAERLSDLLTDGSSGRRTDEERWLQVGAMLDTVLFEDDVARRRQHVMETASLRRALETWWCKAGGTTTHGISGATYRTIHGEMYKHILQLDETTFTTLVNKVVEKDFEWDSEGGSEVQFGRWCISLLEIADNWIPSCDGEAYAAFLTDLMNKIFVPKPPPPPPATPDRSRQRMSIMSTDATAQAELVEALRRNAQTYVDPPLIKTQRTMRHTVEYVRVPPLNM